MVSSHTHSNSLSARLRQRRMRFLDAALSGGGTERLSIIDLGGTASFWEMNLRHLKGEEIARIDIFNIDLEKETSCIVDGVEVCERVGDVTNLSDVPTMKYDVAFSNSVIEHVGNLGSQQRFACEIRRVAKRFVVQTPNRSFPLEPHFYVPFFQHLPLGFRSWLHQRIKLGWLEAEVDPLTARIDCDQIRLLSRRELTLLFPEAEMHFEWLGGLVKSFIMTGKGNA